MKTLLVFCSLWAISFSADNDVCYNTFVSYCAHKGGIPVEVDYSDCSATYGAANLIMNDLSKFANTHIALSFDYLLLSTNFGSYEKDRKGFEKLFRQLSDSTWEDGIDVIKHTAKRGGIVDFMLKSDDIAYGKSVSSVNEIQGLSRALDSQKNLAAMTFKLHQKAGDPEISSYLENSFLHKQADTIRSLSGHISDVKKMLDYPDQRSVSLFLFDEYLRHH
ncbi:ferritin light chain [Hetaerina americana]|uniref:ferritin light chain n=1 Tax=Hetaerina americana TaxID=62018 RepID=UPI003A7F1E91